MLTIHVTVKIDNCPLPELDCTFQRAMPNTKGQYHYLYGVVTKAEDGWEIIVRPPKGWRPVLSEIKKKMCITS